jgi:hypothetical protein
MYIASSRGAFMYAKSQSSRSGLSLNNTVRARNNLIPVQLANGLYDSMNSSPSMSWSPLPVNRALYLITIFSIFDLIAYASLYWIRQQVQEEKIKLVHISTKAQLAVIGRKPLSKPLFQSLAQRIISYYQPR